MIKELLTPEDISEISVLRKKGKPVLLNVYAPWCGFSKRFLETVKAANDKWPEITFFNLDVTREELKKMATNVGVTAYPTFFCINKDIDANEVYRTISALLSDSAEENKDLMSKSIFKNTGFVPIEKLEEILTDLGMTTKPMGWFAKIIDWIF